ncbi:MAG: type I-U CRISPR-associated protein Cas8c [Hydrogenophilaceae bacterium]|jgi:CRISPR-associated protein Csx14|nr:type I-U CRISPR-associated protein Cas8c [Hydrogenophilaceae bacterium]
MAEASIPVDLSNPGQVFACLGFLEAAEVLLGGAEGGFEWEDGASAARFLLQATGLRDPVEAAIEFVLDANAVWFSPRPDVHERDGGATVVQNSVSSSREPKAADLPAVLRGAFEGRPVELSFGGYWSDGTNRFATTFKKSTNGASSHVRFENARGGIRKLWTQARVALTADPLSLATSTESLFRLDPGGYSDPINAGTSPDTLRKGGIDTRVASRPACEAFAVIGLESARPSRIDNEAFRYCVWRAALPVTLARAGLGTRLPFTETRAFKVDHVEVKKGGDRKLLYVHEEL